MGGVWLVETAQVMTEAQGLSCHGGKWVVLGQFVKIVTHESYPPQNLFHSKGTKSGSHLARLGRTAPPSGRKERAGVHRLL